MPTDTQAEANAAQTATGTLTEAVTFTIKTEADVQDAVRSLMQVAKALFRDEVLAFCREYVEDDVRVAGVRAEYGDFRRVYLTFRCEVDLPEVPEKRQVPFLRAIEQAWEQADTPGAVYRRAEYHPTSKLKTRRLTLTSQRRIPAGEA